MSENLPSVSVVIPARPDSTELPRALQSVAEQDYPRIIDVVVACSDVSRFELPEWVVVADNPTGTTPAGLNRAIQVAVGDVIVRCDAHAALPSGYVSLAVQTLTGTDADVVGGMQVPVGKTAWEKAIAAAMTSPLGAADARYRVGGEPGPVETVYLGVFRRKSLEMVGGYDESFLRNQDYELNHRIIESGGTVWFDPRLRVTYRPRSSLRALAKQYFDYGRGKRRFNRKHPGHLRWRQVAPVVLTGTLTISIVFALFSATSLILPVAYLIALTLAARGNLRVAAALATMHLSWGFGFMRG